MIRLLEDINGILYSICAAIAFLALIYKLRILRTDRSAIQIALVGSFLFLFLTYAVSTPVLWKATSRAVGIINFSGLFTQSCVIITVAFQQLVLLHLSHERRIAWRKAVPRLAALTLILIIMVTLFFIATSVGEKPTTFAVTQAQYYPAYLSVYLLGYGANLIDLFILTRRYAKTASTPWLRRGLLTIATAVPLSLIYVACRAADIIAGQFGTSGHVWEPIAPIAVSTGAVIKAIGWTMPDWGPHLSKLWQWLDRHRAYRDLKPLHREVTAQVPEPVLELGDDIDLRTRLYRRVVEIRDAQWALRTWMEPGIAKNAEQLGTAAGLTGIDLAATIEAAQLKAALQAKIRQEQPAAYTDSPRVAAPPDLAAELAFQRKLARAFAISPIVTSALAQPISSPASHKEAT
ncbi:MAB_1171c family putative transporter [Streptomyces sp. NPDC059008]|uniref:MAB_1171c family putative transporter n=1 Tax=Streptomyces sp. NPDC059008 TaxID=3346693 RepID=UPI00368782CE